MRKALYDITGSITNVFGMYVVEVLRGANNQRIRDGHDKLPVYGIAREKVRALVADPPADPPWADAEFAQHSRAAADRAARDFRCCAKCRCSSPCRVIVALKPKAIESLGGNYDRKLFCRQAAQITLSDRRRRTSRHCGQR